MSEATIDIETVKLAKGWHGTPEFGMCVMEMAAYLAKEPHSDRPACVSPVIGAFLRQWNDDLDDETRQKLKPYAAKVLNTKASAEIETRRAWMVTDWMVREHTPAWLDLAGLAEQAAAVRGLPEITKASAAASMGVLNEARTRSAAAWAVAGDVAGAVAGAAAWDAARAAAGDAARSKLKPTVQGIQASAFALLDRLIAVSK
jgi:hypothetical protein